MEALTTPLGFDLVARRHLFRAPGRARREATASAPKPSLPGDHIQFPSKLNMEREGRFASNTLEGGWLSGPPLARPRGARLQTPVGVTCL